MPIITNTLGYFALLAVPALVLIYFLQRKAQTLPVSTLFLLEQCKLPSRAGRRFERWSHTLPFWLQLLAILILTWILLLPRFIGNESTQRIAIVVDSSASMTAYRDHVLTTLAEKLPTLQGNAKHADFLVIDQDPSEERLYRGASIEELLTTFQNWHPRKSARDPNDALRIARAKIGQEGLLVYLTDHDGPALPFAAQRLSVGTALPNCGFTSGVEIERDGEVYVWKALVRNLSDSTQTRTWTVRTASGSPSPPETIKIPPGELAIISGRFPDNETQLILELSPDALTVDDVLPLVIPQPKTLQIKTTVSQKYTQFTDRLLKGFEVLSPAADTTDLTIISYNPLQPELPDDSALIMIDESATGQKFLGGGIIEESHPLIDGLNWQGLAVRDCIEFELQQNDQILVWQGERPLIALRELPLKENTSTRPLQLIFNFDLLESNALRLPATAVLFHRFFARLSEDKVAFERLNLESLQKHEWPNTLDLETTSNQFLNVETGTSAPLDHIRSMPPQAGFLRVNSGENQLLEAAVQFADSRESDLRSAATVDSVSLSGTAIQQQTTHDRLWRFWAATALALLLAAWFMEKRKRNEADTETFSHKSTYAS